LFAFVKEHERLKKHEAKALIEQMLHHALRYEQLKLSSIQLEGFEKALKLLDLNSRVQSILVMVLMNFLKEVERAR
jgi:hypothetical protein